VAHQKPHDPMANVVLIGSIIVLLATLYVLISNLFSTIENNTTKGADDLSLQMAAADINIQPLGAVHTVDKSVAPKARTGEEVYGAICTGCHETGALAAPKTNTKEDWTNRLANGLKGLMDSAINGKGQMPARGGDPSLTDDEIQNAILYMTTKAGIDLSSEAVAADAPATKEGESTDTAAATAPAPTAPAVAPAANTENSVAPAAPQAPAQVNTPNTPAAPQAPAQVSTPAAPQAPEVSSATPAPTATPAAPAPASTPEATPAPEAPAPTATPEVTPTPEAPSTTPAADNANATGPVATEQGEKIYKSLCFSCHDMGIAGSPKLGDKEAWTARIATGMDALYASSINGKGAMPAKGGNPSLSEEDVKAAVDYMIFHAK
jgi:cytochrome c5